MEEVPVDEYTLPLSKAEVVVEGENTCDGVGLKYRSSLIAPPSKLSSSNNLALRLSCGDLVRFC